MTKSDLQKKLYEVFIRFNTSPKLYQKSDYLTLLSLLKDIINELPEDKTSDENTQIIEK